MTNQKALIENNHMVFYGYHSENQDRLIGIFSFKHSVQPFLHYFISISITGRGEGAHYKGILIDFHKQIKYTKEDQLNVGNPISLADTSLLSEYLYCITGASEQELELDNPLNKEEVFIFMNRTLTGNSEMETRRGEYEHYKKVVDEIIDRELEM